MAAERSRRGGRNQRGGRRRSDDAAERLAFAFRLEVAEELLAMLRDDDGVPDEELLDEAADDLANPVEPRQARREQLLLWMSPRERDEVVALLEEDLYDGAPRADAKVVRHVAHHLARRLSARVEGGATDAG